MLLEIFQPVATGRRCKRGEWALQKRKACLDGLCLHDLLPKSSSEKDASHLNKFQPSVLFGEARHRAAMPDPLVGASGQSMACLH